MVRRTVFGGVDIGGTKTAIVLSSRPPAVLKRIVFPTEPERGPAHTIRRIIASLREALFARGLAAADLHSIGISCGSPLDPINGIIQSPPNLATWKDVPIKSLLEEEFQVPCFLENDANAGALAEYWFGSGKGCKNMVFLTMGTGLGSGLILDGRLFRGASNLAGEVGHIRISRTGPIGYGKIGSAEAWASGGGMARLAERVVRLAVARGKATELAQGADGKPPAFTAQRVWESAQRGDRVAQSIVNITARRLGETLAILIDILNPERIVVGGLALRMGEALLGPARQVVAQEALPGTAAACQIVSASLGEQIGDVAALCVALNARTSAPTEDPAEVVVHDGAISLPPCDLDH
jgi:glucokinase